MPHHRIATVPTLSLTWCHRLEIFKNRFLKQLTNVLHSFLLRILHPPPAASYLVINRPLLRFPSTDPDIVSGDGVYSRHATKVNADPGRFSFRFHVDDNENQAFVATLPKSNQQQQRGRRQKCCGSIVSINPDETEKTGVFRRSVAGPVVHVFPSESKGSHRTQDTTPPNRIGDLKVFISLLTVPPKHGLPLIG